MTSHSVRGADPAQEAAALRSRGNQQLASGELAAAESSYRRALELEPQNVRAHNNLGQVLIRLGHAAEAAASYERAIAIDPTYALAYHNLGIALQQQALEERALAAYDRATQLQPALAEAWCNRGAVLLELGRASEALSSYGQALALRADFSEALIGRANTYQQLRRFEAAHADYVRVLALRPAEAEILSNDANALLELRRPGEALARCDQALSLRPDFPEAHNNRSGALNALNREAEALAACDRALALRPGYVQALCNRGKFLRQMGEHEAAQASLREALALDPDLPEARIRLLMALLPVVPKSAEDSAAGRRAFDAELTRFHDWQRAHPSASELAVVGSSQPFPLAYQELPNRELLVRHGEMCCDLMARWQARSCPQIAGLPATAAGGPVRFALVSAFVREHAIHRALTRGWIEQLGGAGVEVGVFHTGAASDAETERARQRAPFFEGGDRTLPEWIEAIQRFKPHAILYPELGMDGTALRLASLRLAGLQLAAWGHPETSGLRTVDCFLSARAFEPPDAEAHYSEELVALPRLGCYYEPYELADRPFDAAKLGLRTDQPLLLCPGTPFKYAPHRDWVWAEIARQLGECQLVFFQPPAAHLAGKLRERLGAAFLGRGVDAAKSLVWVPWQAPADFFSLMRRADACLDTLGFSGFNTAMQAIECDLPVVGFEGRFMRGRLASGVLRSMGVEELIARDETEYIALAVRLARDSQFRNSVRARLRAAKHALFRDRAPVEALAAFLHQRLAPL